MSSTLPITNERGESLIALFPAGDPPPPELPEASFALVLARRGRDVLLVHNRRRGVWELPGGWIDSGESAERCASRELAEESGQKTDRLNLCAWMLLERAKGRGSERIAGKIFAANLTDSAAFLVTGEIERIGYWRPDALPSPTSHIDAALVAHFYDR
nr:NUDIX hydrolase [Luteimonas sp. XNQY3]